MTYAARTLAVCLTQSSTLKGAVPGSFSVVLRSIESAPQAGTLAVAYLEPVKASATAASPPPPTFAFGGRPALVEALPAGVTAADVRLP